MPRNFGDLLTEFYGRGFDYLDDGGTGEIRAQRMVNDANHLVGDLASWPWHEAFLSGASPLTIPDLNQVGAVVCDRRSLCRRSAPELLAWFGDLDREGTPECFYVLGGDEIHTFPESTETLGVSYWRTEPDMVNLTDEPLMPERFRTVIIEYAVAAAYRDDQSPDHQVATQAGDAIVARMRDWAGLTSPRATYWPAVGDDC